MFVVRTNTSRIHIHFWTQNKEFYRVDLIHSGSGTIFLVDSSPGGMIVVKRFEWNDALFDVTWSENNEHVCVTGSGDGSIQVWDFAQQQVS